MSREIGLGEHRSAIGTAERKEERKEKATISEAKWLNYIWRCTMSLHAAIAMPLNLLIDWSRGYQSHMAGNAPSKIDFCQKCVC